jgi:hypothetical protein
MLISLSKMGQKGPNKGLPTTKESRKTKGEAQKYFV